MSRFSMNGLSVLGFLIFLHTTGSLAYAVCQGEDTAVPLPSTFLNSEPCNPLQIVSDACHQGFKGHDYVWFDSQCQPRLAALVHNTDIDPVGKYGGYMRQYHYGVEGRMRACVGNQEAHPGFGALVNHFKTRPPQPPMFPSVASVREMGEVSRTAFAGRHHAIHEFSWSYLIDTYEMRSVVHWFFATGRDHPLWAVTLDLNAVPAHALHADTRSPYGDIQWDGGAHADVDGVGWGDRYQFQTLTSPVSLQSGWDYSVPNLIPFSRAWSQKADAEMGLVQTQTYTQHDAGGSSIQDQWGKRSPEGPMPAPELWPYQINQYELPYTFTSKRLAWGSMYGAVGQLTYQGYASGKKHIGYPYQSYAVYIVLGQHSRHAVLNQVHEVEAAQATYLKSVQGVHVLTHGPAGLARSDTHAYEPVGYNPIYGTWEMNAYTPSKQTSKDLIFEIDPTRGALHQPIFVIHHWTYPGKFPQSVYINQRRLTPDVDYFSSNHRATRTLWLTLAHTVDHPTRIRIRTP